nr:superoxide dismutase family protein [Salipiger sp. IMCC34102]
MNIKLPLAATALLLATPALAETHGMEGFSAEVQSNEDITGSVTVTEETSGVFVVTVDLEGVPEGVHGIHLHETGDCSADDYSSAGGHLADGREHGVKVEGGPHPGDLPNATVGADGVLSVTHFNTFLTTEMMADEDGTGFIVHSDPDDYESQPSGDAGSRIACAVLVEPQS